MKSTTALAGLAVDGFGARVFDVGGLFRRLQSLADSRHRKGLRYPLAVVLGLIVLAKLSGEDQPSGIASWVALRRRQLTEVLHLDWPKMPHHNTYRRIIESVVDPEQFERVVSEHLGQLSGVGKSVLVAFDGKTLRGTIDADKPRGEHLLVAYLPEEGIVLAQVPAGDHDNEIVAAPKLLKGLDLRGKVAIGDAIQTQRELSVQILEAGGDYLWFVKANQPKLREDIERLFRPDSPTVLGGMVPNDFKVARTLDKGHGRLEVRQITVSSLLKGYSDWPGLEQVFKLERMRMDLKSHKSSTEVVYGLTSRSPKRATPSKLLYLSRTYWGIESGLHGRRDVTFREDHCRLTRGTAGRVMATINNLVISLLCHRGATNLAQARRECDANLNLAVSFLSASPVS